MTADRQQTEARVRGKGSPWFAMYGDLGEGVVAADSISRNVGRLAGSYHDTRLGHILSPAPVASSRAEEGAR